MKKLRKFLDAIDYGQSTEQQCWLDTREAEYRLNGLSERDAKEKAMSDWHTYEADKVA